MVTYRTQCEAAGITSADEFYRGNAYLILRPRTGKSGTAWVIRQNGRDVMSFHVARNVDKVPQYLKAETAMIRHFFATELVKSPFGAYGDREFIEERLGEIGVTVKQFWPFSAAQRVNNYND